MQDKNYHLYNIIRLLYLLKIAGLHKRQLTHKDVIEKKAKIPQYALALAMVSLAYTYAVLVPWAKRELRWDYSLDRGYLP